MGIKRQERVLGITILCFFMFLVSSGNGWEYIPYKGVLKYPSMEAIGYISREKVTGIGEIIATSLDDSVLLGKGELVYIVLDKGYLPKEGDQYNLYRNTRIERPDIGFLVENVGRLRIIEVGKERHKALIVKSHMAVNVGDRLLPFKSEDEEKYSPDIEIKSTSSSLMGRIVIADQNKELFGKGDIVYIDLGSHDGVQSGNCFSIYRIPTETSRFLLGDEERRESTKIRPEGSGIIEPLGELIVLSVQEKTSTALVVKSIAHLIKGDRIKSPCGWEDRIVKGIPKPPEVKAEKEEVKVEEKPALPSLKTEPAKEPERDLEAERRREAEIRAFMEKDIHFDFDRYVLTEEAKTVLKEKAQWLNRNPEVKVIIEGHCDERGTNSYNLALGHRRAAMVKGYLVSLGIDESRLSIISYGEERPLDHGHDETAWQKNRRVHFVVESK